jgi:hypothetical protein
MKGITTAQRSHLLKLAEHVNQLSGEQFAASQISSGTGRALQQLNQNYRVKVTELQRWMPYEGDERYERHVTPLKAEVADLETRITEARERHARQSSVTADRTSVSAPLRTLFLEVCKHLQADPSDFGFAILSPLVEETTIISTGGRA